MIPHPVAPLKGLTVLVTRPAAQAENLCAHIEALGGAAVRFPTIEIEAIPVVADETHPDWLVFISANAVRHGMSCVRRGQNTRVAAIGKATADALLALDVHVDVIPETGANSEALLGHPALANMTQQSVLIVKGAGGRELLQEALTQRAAQVSALEVYRRVCPRPDAAVVAQLEAQWSDDGIGMVTLTSIATLDNLLVLLSEAGRLLLRAAPFVAVSERIGAAARAQGLSGEYMLARGADDDAIVGAIAAWHARAR